MFEVCPTATELATNAVAHQAGLHESYRQRAMKSPDKHRRVDAKQAACMRPCPPVDSAARRPHQASSPRAREPGAPSTGHTMAPCQRSTPTAHRLVWPSPHALGTSQQSNRSSGAPQADRDRCKGGPCHGVIRPAVVHELRTGTNSAVHSPPQRLWVSAHLRHNPACWPCLDPGLGRHFPQHKRPTCRYC